MSEHRSKDQATKGIFDAAGEIAKILESYSKDEQQRILRLVVEGLSLRDPLAKSQEMPASPGSPATADSATRSPATDVKSFVTQKKPKTDQQFVAVVAYFYQFEAPPGQREESIDAATMKDTARLVGWGQVRDWNMTLNNAKRSGYLDPAERGAFKLSSVGENLVAITLPGNDVSESPKGSGARRAGSRKKPTSKSNAKRAG